MQDIRGIGRRMDWRGVVLEHYIDQLRSKCLEIQRDAEHKLASDVLFGTKRTVKTVRTQVVRMRAFAENLRRFHARPFARALAHASNDLEECAVLMESASAEQSPEKMQQARVLLCRVYRSMRMLELHWSMEEVLVVVADAHHRKTVVEASLVPTYLKELLSVCDGFHGKDAVTHEPIELGFKRKILPRSLPYLRMAISSLRLQVSDAKNRLHTDTAYYYLKEACVAF